MKKAEAYESAVKKFRALYVLRAALQAEGCLLRTSRITGIHRNTIRRVLAEGGYTYGDVRRMARSKCDLRHFFPDSNKIQVEAK